MTLSLSARTSRLDSASQIDMQVGRRAEHMRIYIYVCTYTQSVMIIVTNATRSYDYALRPALPTGDAQACVR